MTDFLSDQPENMRVSEALEAFFVLSPEQQQDLICLLQFLSLPEES